jgi:hypothetical protein
LGATTNEEEIEVKCGARVALGVAGGYLLGRTKKMKVALALAGMVAGRRAGGPAEVLGGATKLLGSSPELARLGDEVRGRLLEAGKGAALAVAARQVEALTDRVSRRVESIGDVGVPRQRGTTEQDEVEEEAPVRAEDEGRAEETPADEAPAARKPPARARPATTSGGRGGEGASATAVVRRGAGGAARAARGAGAAGKAATGRSTGRTTRTRRSEGNG